MSENFGKMVREAREQRGWSQEFLAAKVGATQSTIDRIESGLTRRSRVLPEIASALDLELPGLEKKQYYVAPVGGFTKVSYVLPKELIDRIEKYKVDIGVSSDDEVVRRIIDDFLKKRDDHNDIINRLMDKFNVLKSMREAAGLVLVNHPLVTRISFEHSGVDFELEEGLDISVSSWGSVIIKKTNGNYYKYYKHAAPEWVSKHNLTDDSSEADDPPF